MPRCLFLPFLSWARTHRFVVMKFFVSVALWMFLAGGLGGLQAGQFVPLSIEDMAAHADLVVRGKVVEKQCLQDNAGRIYTRIDLEVFETWKGSVASNHLSVVHGGGIVGKKQARVSGQAEYSLGEEVVVFLIRNSRGEGVTLGLAQGKFEIGTDPSSGDKLVRNLFHGQATSGSGAGSTLEARVPERVTLPALKEKVQGGQQ